MPFRRPGPATAFGPRRPGLFRTTTPVAPTGFPFPTPMTTATIAALAAGVAALALGLLGFLLGSLRTRRALQHTDADRLADAQRVAEAAARAASSAEVARLREDHARALEAERARLRAEVEEELAEERREARRERQRQEQRHTALQQRTARLAEREAALAKGADALDALRRETEAVQAKATKAAGALQTFHHEARVRRDDADRAAREAETRERDAGLLQDRLTADLARTEAEREALQHATEETKRRLEHVAGLSRHEALDALKHELLDEARFEAAQSVKEIRDEAKLRATREAKHVILTAIQRTAASHAIENTVSVVNISSDEMKGRIIGREGRNIRAFEAATGLEVIVDDTPEAVILSGFDPVRREVGRLALGKLIQDGRIHPTRIEEVVEKVRAEIEEEIVETGERTVIELNLHGLHPDLIRYVGRMKYRTSYGQNLLAHSMETARLASLMAAELGLDPAPARRAGLLHDIGKVVEEEIEQPHAIVGMELLRKYREHEDVLNAVGAHHDEIEMTCLIAPLVQAADAISGARPGARREAFDAYIKRLEKLEAVAASFRGVERVYAIQAGREIRVLVNHDLISDALAEQLARDISKKIEGEMQYPGQVKVTVIREVRSVAYAK